ncbi:ribonuclease 3-like protein 3 [Coffea eugenioides]|uniref:ribonuclease 3-like protein 3 n=1 Tax=Coffea eugenioides TaxID=49369 RepID=UPI000F60BD76|nr:ribonuclease 3-like protein 3 [Coffea eugenioides]
MEPHQNHPSADNPESHNQEDEAKNKTLQEEEELMMDESSQEEIEEIIGYKFHDPSLLQEAFTDSSFKENCLSYERLEYIGDSVLNLLMAKEHYFLYPELLPGNLTKLRAANVNTEKLARVAVKCNLHKFLRHKKPLLSRQIQEFSEAISAYPLHSTGLVAAPKVLADIVESLIGAIFLDSNSSLDTTWQVVKNLLQPMITLTTIKTHPVTKLHEICQKNGLKVEFVDMWKETGEIEVYVDHKYAGTGKYCSKRLIALNRAAANAYNHILKKLSTDGLIQL